MGHKHDLQKVLSQIARSRPQPRLFRLTEDDDRFGLYAGDVLECVPYWLDPQDKLTVVRRVSDGFDPECNVYRHQVEPALEGGR